MKTKSMLFVAIALAIFLLLSCGPTSPEGGFIMALDRIVHNWSQHCLVGLSLDSVYSTYSEIDVWYYAPSLVCKNHNVGEWIAIGSNWEKLK